MSGPRGLQVCYFKKFRSLQILHLNTSNVKAANGKRPQPKRSSRSSLDGPTGGRTRPETSQQPFSLWTSSDDTGTITLSPDMTIWMSANTHTYAWVLHRYIIPLELTVSPSPVCPFAESCAAQGKDRSDTNDVLKEFPPHRCGYLFQG